MLPMDEVLAHYAAHGWARVGRLADDDVLAAMRARADDLMLGRVTIEDLFFQLDAPTGRYEDLTFGRGYEGPSLSYRKIEKLERDDVFRAWINAAPFERIARALIAGDVAIYRAVLFNKGEDGGSPLPWHQDGGSFWGLDRDPVLQVWTALDDAPEDAGCVEVVSGSHTRGLATPLGGLIPERLTAGVKGTLLPARAGDVILIHNNLWHRSGRNTTKRPRRALSVCYMSAETRCLRKKRAPREFVRVFRDTKTR